MIRNRSSCGFTLVELLVVIAILGILMAIALPNRDVIKNSRLATETNDLLADLALARAEAATRGKRTTLCVSSDGTSCGTGSSWNGGRIVFVDGATEGVVDSTDTVVRYNQGLSGSKIVITASGFSVAATATLNYLQYRPNGATGSDAGGEFKICDDRTGSFGRVIAIGVTGRVALKTTNASCP